MEYNPAWIEVPSGVLNCPSIVQYSTATKIADFLISLAIRGHGDRLHPAGAGRALHAPPKQRADLVPDEAVQNPARLLGVDQVQIEGLRMGDCGQNRLGGDFIEENTLNGTVAVFEQLAKSQQNRFSRDRDRSRPECGPLPRQRR